MQKNAGLVDLEKWERSGNCDGIWGVCFSRGIWGSELEVRTSWWHQSSERMRCADLRAGLAERGRVGARRREDDGELPVRRRACGENQLLERRGSKI